MTPSANGMEIYETQTVMGKGGGNKIAPEADVRMPEAAEDCVLTAQCVF